MKRGALICLCALLLSGCGQAADPFDLDESRIRRDTELICAQFPNRVTGTQEERAACDWLEGALVEAGFSAVEGTLARVPFSGLGELTGENLVAVCNADPDLPLVSVVAHYDAYPGTPGAGDNAAGAAVLLELARYLGPSNAAFPCEIRLVLLGSEENGYHGSRAYVDGLTPEDRARHLGGYNMDISAAAGGEGAVLVCCTVGGIGPDGVYGDGSFLAPAENAVSRTIAAAYGELYGAGYGGTCGVGESDHVSFHNRQLDAANICWRRMAAGLPQLPAAYHRAEDIPEALDYGTARTTGRCILRAVQILTQAE